MKKLALSLVMVAGAALWVSAQGNYKNGQDLTGSWRIQVVIPPGKSICAGPNPCTIFAMATAMSDGTIIQSAAVPGTSTGHGVWTRTGLRQFTVKTIYFRLDLATDLPIGTAETVSVIEIDRNGLSATGQYFNTLDDLAGNVVGDFKSSAAATRIVP